MNFYRLHADFFGRMQYNKICQKNMIPQKAQKVQKVQKAKKLQKVQKA